MSDAPILVADIGGTNARFGLAKKVAGRMVVSNVQRFRAEDFETPRDAADAYVEAVAEKPSNGCFAIAAPITGDAIEFTNSHWVLKTGETQLSLGLERLEVINDFYALAAGVGYLPEEAFAIVRDGTGDPSTPSLVIGPGTGLGQALLVPTDYGIAIVSTEGGHTNFAPTNEREIEVLRFIAREHPRVSVERLLSGRGLVNIHRALCAVADTQRVSLQADEITRAALTGEYPIAVQAVEMFCAVLGTVAGDAVLSNGARGGVTLGGGILPKIRDFFIASEFITRFNAKGRMRHYVDSVPIRMVVAEDAALFGSASRLL